ncbi:MAG TPA: ribonuclease D [Gammaproteobacteria bacterium]|nr:ribonuclease D [Gammaproteobacteria bacterium]
MADFKYIDRADQLAEFCRASADSDWLGLDTEFLREKTYYPLLCLVQIAGEHGIACIDPLAIDDLAPLRQLLLEPRLVKVLHAARQDVEVLHQSLQAVPRPVFDTQLAAGLLGHGDQIGYGALVADVAGVQLAKAHTRADWSCRPLDADALAYAADDVRYLGELYRHLRQRLDAAGRSEWLNAEAALLGDPALWLPDPQTAWLRVRGQSRLEDAAARGALRALAAWRERRAMDKDRPRRWILNDDTLLDLAVRMPRSEAELREVGGLDGLLKARQGAALLAAIAEGANEPLPAAQNVVPSSEDRATVRHLGKMVRERAAAMKLSPALLANRRQLERLVQGERDLPVLKGWRREVIGEDLLGAATAESA